MKAKRDLTKRKKQTRIAKCREWASGLDVCDMLVRLFLSPSDVGLPVPNKSPQEVEAGYDRAAYALLNAAHMRFAHKHNIRSKHSIRKWFYET